MNEQETAKDTVKDRIRQAKLQLGDDFGDEEMMEEAIFKAGQAFGRKDERLLLASELGGLIEIYGWDEAGLRDFRKGIEAKLKEWVE